MRGNVGRVLAATGEEGKGGVAVGMSRGQGIGMNSYAVASPALTS